MIEKHQCTTTNVKEKGVKVISQLLFFSELISLHCYDHVSLDHRKKYKTNKSRKKSKNINNIISRK